MIDELIEKFDKLPIDSKRNEINSTVMMIANVLNSYMEYYDETRIIKPYNYKLKYDFFLTESEFLTREYKDLMLIKTNLIALLNYYNNDRTDNNEE